MPTTYAFQVSLPVTDTLPRNRCINRFHMEHVAGGVVDTDLENMCSDIIAMYQARYHNTSYEIECKAYDVGPVPNYPRAVVSVNVGTAWGISTPREVALCLSYAAANRGNKSERGRAYLMPQLDALAGSLGVRPSNTNLNWALDFYDVPNESFPDLGGVDWKFGVYSRKNTDFTQSTQAWVNDDWDVQRRRGLREATRVSAQREG
jgi:hypothetical protein